MFLPQYQKIFKVRSHEAVVKLSAGTSLILSSISESFKNTKTAILFVAFILIIISAFCDILESMRNTPKRHRISYVLMSAVKLLIGIFFYGNSWQEPLTNINSVNMCMVYFYSSVVLVPILQYVSQWHISVYRWGTEIFLWLHLIALLYVPYLFVSIQTPDNSVFTLTFIKLLLSVILVVFNMYMESKLHSSKHSQTSFFTALLQDDDDGAFTSLKVNKTVFTVTKESEKQSSKKKIVFNLEFIYFPIVSGESASMVLILSSNCPTILLTEVTNITPIGHDLVLNIYVFIC